MVDYAERNGVTDIRLEQTCARPKRKEQHGLNDGHDGDEDDEVEESVVSGTTEFNGKHLHAVRAGIECRVRSNPVKASERVLTIDHHSTLHRPQIFGQIVPHIHVQSQRSMFT